MSTELDSTAAPAVWGDVVGQTRAIAQLQAAARAPVHAYLLVGPRGSGKRAAARAFAAELLAAATDDPAAAERAVRLALAEQHPDLVVVEPVGARISAEQARDVVREAALSPVESARKVLVLCDMHRIEQIAPILLKSVEEPPATTVFVLLAEDVVPDLVTLASRCVRIDFEPVPEAAIAARLEQEGTPAERAAQAAAASGGDVGRARLLATDPRLALRRDHWRTLPERLDGTGAAVALAVDELLAMIKDAQGPLEEQHAEELAALEERVARYGERGAGRRDLVERHKRELRRHRADELRFGFATLAGRYRDELVHGNTRGAVAAIAAINKATEMLARNPNEPLLLQALFLQLPAEPHRA